LLKIVQNSYRRRPYEEFGMKAEDVVWQQVVDHKLLRIAHNAAYFGLVAPRGTIGQPR
jgi:hypothetical protein